jgi:hypothetical protein
LSGDTGLIVVSLKGLWLLFDALLVFSAVVAGEDATGDTVHPIFDVLIESIFSWFKYFTTTTRTYRFLYF